MEEKGMLIKVGKGALRSTVITIVLLIILTVVMSVKDLSPQIISVYYLLVTCASIIYGSIYAAKKNNKKGWLVGLLVSMLYMVIFHVLRFVFQQDDSITSKDFIRLALALLVGTLSGMLGINL